MMTAEQYEERLDKKVPKSAINEMRRILKIAKLGDSSKYSQKTFHCGTAHCFAGWKIVFDYKKANKIPRATQIIFTLPLQSSMVEFCETKLLKKFDKDTLAALSVWLRYQFGRTMYIQYVYAMTSWGLSHEEADLLFNPNATVRTIEEAIDKLASGYRKRSQYEEWVLAK